MATASKRLRFEVLRRDNYACRYCGRGAPEVELTVDAVVPEALGGSHKDPANLVAACRDCNSGKSATAPDAPLVADVAQDALRWSQAIQVAAERMRTDIAGRQAVCEEFDRRWNNWTCGADNQPVPRPDDWPLSIDTFLAAGLPLDVLYWCLTKAMSSRARPEGKWRYMCGIAWKKVDELHAQAKALVVGPGDDEDLSPETLAARRDMACELLGDLPEVERETELDEMRSIFGDDPDLEVHTAFAIFHGAIRERKQLGEAVGYLLCRHPDGARFLSDAHAHLKKTVGVFTDIELARVAAVMLMQAQPLEVSS